MSCEHLVFDGHIEVNRLQREEGGPVTAYRADMRVWCADCGEPFMFYDMPMGMLAAQPTRNLVGDTLTVPLRPASAPDNFGLDTPGYTVRQLR